MSADFDQLRYSGPLRKPNRRARLDRRHRAMRKSGTSVRLLWQLSLARAYRLSRKAAGQEPFSRRTA